MSIRTYREFDVLAEDATYEGDHLRGLTVRLLDSPEGGAGPVPQLMDAPRPEQLSSALARLEARLLDTTGVIGLGESLADLLFPSAIRELLVQSLKGLGRNEGLRIRLRLDPALAEIPWEFAWIARQQDQRDSTGFLALDPRVSLVRHETVKGNVAVDATPRDRRVVAVLANPDVPGRIPLNLDAERVNLENALAGVPGITVDFARDPTLEDLRDALVDGADIFHFAGHGIEDSLVVVGGDRAPWELPADQLAVNLRARGVQLAVLGACESGGRSAHDPWSGVATRLIAADIPAVVAMQYRIGDRTAIAFSQALYRSLAAGMSLDEAVSSGRLAIFNATTGGPADEKRTRLWRDWGVPVVYLRPGAVVSLASVAEPKERERLLEELDADFRVSVANVKRGGKVIGAKADLSHGGRLTVEVKARDVEGDVIGGIIRNATAGAADLSVSTGDVGTGGLVIGGQIDSLGGRRAVQATSDPPHDVAPRADARAGDRNGSRE